MAKHPSATDEVMKRIKGLDREESLLLRDLARQRASLEQLEAELVQVGNARRQWEYVLKQLGVDEDPTLENKAIVIPVKQHSNVIGILG